MSISFASFSQGIYESVGDQEKLSSEFDNLVNLFRAGDFEEAIEYADKISPMGNASSNDCAKYCISLFSDYTRMVTMQNLFHDGGFSKTGVSQDIVDMF